MDSLVAIDGDKEVHELQMLCGQFAFVELFVEHKDSDNGMHWHVGLDYIDIDAFDDEYDDDYNEDNEEGSESEYDGASEDSDEEIVMVKEKMKTCREEK